MNDGGPAFPQPVERSQGDFGTTDAYPGMTLRDYFAGQVLVGESHWRAMKTVEEQELAASECYSMADAMLLARQTNLTPKSTTE